MSAMNSFSKGYALLVGIANYTNVRRLPPTVLKDAEDISSVLKDPLNCGYPESHIKHLVDVQATADQIRSGFRWLAEQTSEGDTAVFFFSGHGGRIENERGSVANNYLIPVDMDPADLTHTAIDGQELISLLRNIKAGRLLILFDCCYAGGIGEAKGISDAILPDFKSGLDENLYARLSTGAGRVIIASSRSDELSWILPGMENSLFTHYLLKALRGEAPTRSDDGVIRVFDIYDYVSENVITHEERQHPVFKGELERNFPVALQNGGKSLQTPHANGGKPVIQVLGNITLSPIENDVLEKMFSDYERIVVKREFGEGYSGCRVFLVRPIITEASGDAQLPAVVKLGPAYLLEKEWRAESDNVRKRMPKVAKVEGTIVRSQSRSWAGLRYPLVGDGQFPTESLRSYIRHASLKDIIFVLNERLFPSMKATWDQNWVKNEVPLRASYEYLLPPSFVIEHVLPSSGSAVHRLKPTLSDEPYQRGDWVELMGVQVRKVMDSKVIFDWPKPSNPMDAPGSHHYWLITDDVVRYVPGEMLDEPITGIIRETRETLLRQYAVEAFGGTLDLTAKIIPLMRGLTLPNPLLVLPAALEESADFHVSVIHGDLNLENILVEYGNRDIQLIDFASVREDHVLHDFLRLEMEVLLYLLPAVLVQRNLPLDALYTLFTSLHDSLLQGPSHNVPVLEDLSKPFQILLAIRRQAQRYIFNWNEYYRGLFIYVLGTLKYRSLDQQKSAPLPKQIAFWSAAIAWELLTRKESQRRSGQYTPYITSSDFRLVFERREVDYEIHGKSTLLDQNPAITVEAHKFAGVGVHTEYLRQRQQLDTVDLSSLGYALYNAAFPQELHESLQQFFTRALAHPDKPRLILDFSQAPELHDLPWELLYDGKQFLLSTGRLLRFAGLTGTNVTPTIKLPLRMLVTINSDGGAEGLDSAQEARLIRAALSPVGTRLQVKVSQNPSFVGILGDLARAEELEEPFYVWHHIGMVRRVKQQIEWIFDEPDGIQSIGMKELNREIQRFASIQLAYFDLHHRGIPLNGLFPTMTAFDVPATVLLYRDMNHPMNRQFAQKFYTSLFSASVEQAFAAACSDSFGQGLVSLGQNVPSLFIRTLERIFTFGEGTIASASTNSSMTNVGIGTIQFKIDTIEDGSATQIGKIRIGSSTAPTSSTNIEFETTHQKKGTLKQIGDISIEEAENYIAELKDLLDAID